MCVFAINEDGVDKLSSPFQNFWIRHCSRLKLNSGMHLKNKNPVIAILAMCHKRVLRRVSSLHISSVTSTEHQNIATHHFNRRPTSIIYARPRPTRSTPGAKYIAAQRTCALIMEIEACRLNTTRTTTTQIWFIAQSINVKKLLDDRIIQGALSWQQCNQVAGLYWCIYHATDWAEQIHCNLDLFRNLCKVQCEATDICRYLILQAYSGFYNGGGSRGGGGQGVWGKMKQNVKL